MCINYCFSYDFHDFCNELHFAGYEKESFLMKQKFPGLYYAHDYQDDLLNKWGYCEEIF